MNYGINTNLKRFRLIANLTQEELANQIGISTQYLGRIERNISTPTLETLIRIADTLNVPIEYFISCSSRTYKELSVMVFADKLKAAIDKNDFIRIEKLLSAEETDSREEK